MKRKCKVIILSIIAAAFIVTGSVTGVMAVITSQSGSITNHFQIGKIETEIIEKIASDGTKDVKIANTGVSDCLIRARITISPSDAGVTLKDVNLGQEAGTWLEAEDGYYYFNGVVPSKGEDGKYNMTTSLFKGYSIPGVEEDGTIQEGCTIPQIQITVTQESIQSCITDQEGNVINAYNSNGEFDQDAAEKIWALYDQQNM